MVEGPIRVCILEKEYSGLHALGVPLSLCIHMQELVRMANALNSGFSVTFYWPWPRSNGVWLLPTLTIGGLGRKGGEEEAQPTISLVLGLLPHP